MCHFSSSATQQMQGQQSCSMPTKYLRQSMSAGMSAPFSWAAFSQIGQALLMSSMQRTSRSWGQSWATARASRASRATKNTLILIKKLLYSPPPPLKTHPQQKCNTSTPSPNTPPPLHNLPLSQHHRRTQGYQLPCLSQFFSKFLYSGQSVVPSLSRFIMAVELGPVGFLRGREFMYNMEGGNRFNNMEKNSSQSPNEMEMSIFTFTHDYYLLDLPPPERTAFYNCFPLYRNCLSFRGEPIRSAPVVRVYGTNDYNEKCCCHVHGFFPYLYIKADQYESVFRDPLALTHFLLKLETLFQDAHRTPKPVIFRGEVEEKLDFYGYHTRKQTFLKVSLLDPQNVTRMRQLLSSGVLGGKVFQCYEAHINYYMQFFSEFNIYGINEMRLCGFTFRRNYRIMPLFEKISSRLHEGIVHRGWDLAELQQRRPECFNVLHKTTTCYIELDFEIQSILNSYELRDSDEEEVHSSDEELLERAGGFRKLKVTVTKALEEIWRDERKRRNRFKIQKPLEGLIDLTRNIESTPEVETGLKDPLWASFLEKAENGAHFLTMLRSYCKAGERTAEGTVRVDPVLSSNYQETMGQMREELIQKVHNRFRFYEQRKNKIIGEIMNGERGELPEWSDEESEGSAQSEGSDDSALSQSRSDDGESRTNNKLAKSEQGNTLKYRKNFKFEMAGFKASGLFGECKFCRQKVIHCECELCPSCGQEDCSCNKLELLENQLKRAFRWQEGKNFEDLQLQYDVPAPSSADVANKLVVEHQKPYYSKLQDLFQHYRLGSNIPSEEKIGQYLQKQLKNTYFFNREPITIQNHKKLPYYYEIYEPKQPPKATMQTFELQYMKDPPTCLEVSRYNAKAKEEKHAIRGSTNKFEDTFVADLLILNYELLIEVPEKNLHYGNPERHPIMGIVFDIYNEQSPSQSIKGVIVLQKYAQSISKCSFLDEIFVVSEERGILSMLINIVFRVDIDIFMSWDMEKKGVRYLLQRGIENGINMSACLSRTNDLQDLFEHINFIEYRAVKETFLRRELLTHGNIIQTAAQHPNRDNSYYLGILKQKLKKRLNKKPILRQKFLFDMQLKGRVNINLNRICQMELKLRSYTLEAVVKHIYQTQIADFTDKYLNNLMTESAGEVVAHIAQKIEYEKLITHELNVIGGIVEKSKIYGADFLSMMERGSQFKIQSIMCRTAKQNDYVTLSATKTQVANQYMLQCRPFVLQPPKEYFSEPVLLFDFQSLYPSVMIAYNICYSTCLGSIKQLFKDGKVKKLGVSDQMTMHLDKICQFMQTNHDDEEIIRALSNYIFVTPNKVAFVKKTLKQGIIPKILLQFLISRIMIKNSSKLYNKQSIKNILKERQNALKLFMNVMYGYTGATFSGRMPCTEIADSVVQLSKYCLRKSIDYLNSHPVYKGKVIYGDTDSIFFHLPTYKIGETFEIGKKLALEITKMFPYPMEMKFQKSYQSLFLVSKKRYYGKSYETSESLPKYEGKGLETVRRDGLPFTSMAMTNILNKLIDTKDLSQLKEQILLYSRKLLSGKVNISEMCMAKEVKLIKYSQKHLPAHGQAAKRLQGIDPMLVPKYGERLKYLIVQGSDILKNRAIPLFEYMLHKQRYHLDLNYYYTKQFLPPLRRTLISLVNLDEWGLINQFSKERQQIEVHTHVAKKNELVCTQCLDEVLGELQKESENSDKVCRKCVGSQQFSFSHCVQWNCSNLYKRRKADEQWRTAKQRGNELKLIKQLLKC